MVNSNRWHHLEAGAFCSKQCLIMEEVEWCCPQEHVTSLSHVSREDLIGHMGCVVVSCQFYWAIGIFPCPVILCPFHPILSSPFFPVCGKNRVLNIVLSWWAPLLQRTSSSSLSSSWDCRPESSCPASHFCLLSLFMTLKLYTCICFVEMIHDHYQIIKEWRKA